MKIIFLFYVYELKLTIQIALKFNPEHSLLVIILVVIEFSGIALK